MSAARPGDDLLEKMRRNPRGDWSRDDVERLCRREGLICKPPTGGGSHYRVAHPSQARILTIPFKRRIKAVYIRDLVDFIDAVRTSVGAP